ncbi:amino acid deaminase [Pseudoduganella sp. DS3]|uniref:Amino acid deaminase n=1 Tax=Pseudoduganella guangdongensis TaxID=2692179 RepID=A0A6N9HCY8_9BURK|nr:amino acid deaminase [Pseudoduganella guangdongensis]MYN01306.1 amino acid deaminase [Pseudoduganella guangdongensis]
MFALPELEEQTLQPGVKGLPIVEPLRQHMIGAQHWNVLAADTSLPVAVLKASALQHNLDWMRSFCARHGVLLAPHGKTTMSPQLIAAQIENGAWGITLATIPQVQIALRYGVRRVILANELVAPADIRAVLHLMQEDAGFEFYALVDSLQGVERLSQAVQAFGLQRPLPLLVELGMRGKRAGCREPEEVMAVARAVAAAPGLQLAGIEGYEGLASDVDTVNVFLGRMAELLQVAAEEDLFAGEQVIISAGGSSYFDLVARGFKGLAVAGKTLLPILRSGCYLTNDHGHYFNQIAELEAREGGKAGAGLRPALEVWATVLSRPEPNLAILSMGKRDAGFDLGLPMAIAAHRPGGASLLLPQGAVIDKMNDQHAYLRWPEGVQTGLQVGDLVGCGISHPCTTFDKWPLLLLVDDSYDVLQAVNTFF